MNTVLTELRIAAYGAWQRRWMALAIAWGVAMLGWLAVAMFPNSYESKARIFVQLDDVLAEQIGKQREFALRLGDLLKKGESKANVMLKPGDVIIIPESMF